VKSLDRIGPLQETIRMEQELNKDLWTKAEAMLDQKRSRGRDSFQRIYASLNEMVQNELEDFSQLLICEIIKKIRLFRSVLTKNRNRPVFVLPLDQTCSFFAF